MQQDKNHDTNSVSSSDLASVAPVISNPPLIDVEKLIASHGHRLEKFIFKHIRNHSDVEDLLQNTYIEAWQHADRFRGDSLPQTWLFGIAMNLIRNHVSRSPSYRYQFEEITEACTPPDYSDPSDSLAQKQVSQQLFDALAEFPKDISTIIEMTCQDNCSYEEVSQQLNIPIGTVRSRLSRTRQTLRERFLDRS